MIKTANKTLIKTGYSPAEILLIENAFETNTQLFAEDKDCSHSEILQDQFNGLMAVVDVLLELDNIQAPESKEYFKYTNEFKPVKELQLL